MRTASARLPPPARAIASRLRRHCRVWSAGVEPTISPVSGSSGICPEQNRRFPVRTAWL